MSTIIMVHGTFATGPETGSRWWQKTGKVEDDLRKFVASETGELKFERIIWSGDNTESARRRAAKDIHAALLKCEQAKDPCCIIGHSHGGSAITSALMLAASQNNRLPCLTKWITVASPFISLNRNRLLFLRLSRLGKSTYVVMVTFGFLAILACLATFSGSQAIVALAAIAFVPLLAAYAAIYFVNARSFGNYDRRRIVRFDEFFGSRWLGLWHQDDEAISGLRSLAQAKLPIFGRHFAVPIVSSLAIFLFPVLLLWILSNAEVMNGVLDYHLRNFGSVKLEGIAIDGKLIGNGESWGINFNLLVTTAWEALKAHLPESAGAVAVLFLLVLVPTAMFLASLFVILIMTGFARLVSRTLSHWLNRLAIQQVRQFSLGGDVVGETAVGAEPFPAWLQKRFPPLPDELAQEITEASNTAASAAIGKFRSLIGQIAFSGDALDPGLLAKRLSWNELIHTTYFDVERFRVLLAYCVAQIKGFIATDALKQHADYRHAEQWYETISGNPANNL